MTQHSINHDIKLLLGNKHFDQDVCRQKKGQLYLKALAPSGDRFNYPWPEQPEASRPFTFLPQIQTHSCK